MKRILPVLAASIIVNSLLFLMMNQMVSGQKHPPQNTPRFQGIELVPLQNSPKAAPGKRRMARKLPAFQKLAALKAPSRPIKKPEAKVRPVQKIQPVPEPVPPKQTQAILPKPILQTPPEPALEPSSVAPLLPDPPSMPSPAVDAVEISPELEVKLKKVFKTSIPASISEVVAPQPEVLTQTEVEKPAAENKTTSEAFELAENRVEDEAQEVEQTEATLEASDDLIALPSKRVEVAAAEVAPSPQKASSAAAFETDVKPLFRMPPRYPRRAVRARLEGMVKIAFTITTNGSVQDPFVLESKPEKLFDQAALRAIRRWKFQPKQVSGKAVARRAIQNIRFSLKRSQ